MKNLFSALLLLVIVVVLAMNCSRNQIVKPKPLPSSVHLSLGNPTDALQDPDDADNFLIVKPQYALSYDKAKGHANWVSWELSNDWLGDTDRSDNFRPDPELPANWTEVTPSDYTNSGFDRGHLCPSADRTDDEADNSATFLMTNIVPQAPELNRESWARLEAYCRSLAERGYRLYIVAGAYGTGGEGSKGHTDRLASGVVVPAQCYKVIVAVANNGTVADISAETPVIAADFPNVSSIVDNKSWSNFITTPAAIESAAGVTFFSNLPETVRVRLRRKRFDPMDSNL